ncbi:helix-turn-helix domain-containing protein [Streptomyces xiamenensis]|uniref:helix-turn-helix domain-containing protein n=1 Tax=Streptomyces xiamenensis TaxID=408015 RepID=UPI0035DF05C3
MLVSSSSSSAAQAAREALAIRLVHLMREGGLTGRALSGRCGWHPAKTSCILTAKATLSDVDLRAWTTVCGAGDQAEGLIATARAVDSIPRPPDSPRWC